MAKISSERCIRGRTVSSLFRTHTTGVEVQISGLRVLYQEDLQAFVQAFIRCILRSSTNALFDYYSEMMVKQWIDFIKLIIKHNIQREEQVQELGGTDWPATQFTCSFPGIKIPKWFGQLYRSGSHARIQLPPNLYDDSNWLGVAVCGYFTVHEHRPTNETTPDSEETCPAQTHPALVCELLTNVASKRIFGTEFTNKAMWLDAWLDACCFTWFIYIPCVLFSRSLNQCDRICAILTTRNPDIWPHACARRLVYKQDVDDLVQILTLSTLKAGSSPFSSSLVFSNKQEEVFQENPQPNENMSFARPKPPSILEISICKIPLPLDNIQLKLNTMRACLFRIRGLVLLLS
ncbi:TMV resistance protein N-like [Pyrus ussuriensis x Pyrus communis]|uniref:TMV resistance protein N-like n=1 Tax=Pyrus ussuriensis x Pyrus communis TaxID=2448454 RepID=A0A5N5HFB2_9ROSA|nr:TMV resistance protein N-like [Pyrus ussuriensis x Pyrus communis]